MLRLFRELLARAYKPMMKDKKIYQNNDPDTRLELKLNGETEIVDPITWGKIELINEECIFTFVCGGGFVENFEQLTIPVEEFEKIRSLEKTFKELDDEYAWPYRVKYDEGARKKRIEAEGE